MEFWSDEGEYSRNCHQPNTPLLHHSIRSGDHDVTAASRPVKAFVPVQFRLVTPIFLEFNGWQDWVIVDNDEGAGSNPASGSGCRGSSAVEQITFQFVSSASFFRVACITIH